MVGQTHRVLNNGSLNDDGLITEVVIDNQNDDDLLIEVVRWPHHWAVIENDTENFGVVFFSRWRFCRRRRPALETVQESVPEWCCGAFSGTFSLSSPLRWHVGIAKLSKRLWRRFRWRLLMKSSMHGGDFDEVVAAWWRLLMKSSLHDFIARFQKHRRRRCITGLDYKPFKRFACTGKRISR